MNAQTMYELLSYLRKERSFYEDKAIRLLRFVYDEVYHDLSEKIDRMEGEDKPYHSIQLVTDFQDGITDYIDDDSSSILYYLKEMLIDGKGDFIDAFFKKTDTYFQIIDNHLYREDDFVPWTLIFNIYVMLRNYHLYKDDFERYNKALDNYAILIAPSGFTEDCYREDGEFCLGPKKLIIDKITGIKDFEDIPILKSKFDIYFKNICNTDEDIDSLDSMLEGLEFAEKVILDMRKLKENDPSFDNNVALKVIEDYFECYVEDEVYFYAPILLYGNRFDYIRDCYFEYINNNEYMDEIMEVVHDFDNNLFKFLDGVNKDGKDSFVSCMDVVFDSDTLQEVWNKLNILKVASSLFALDSSSFSYQDVLDKIKELSSDKNKKQFRGQKIMYVSDTVNKVDRPTSILDRMTEIYSTFCGISEEEVDEDIVDQYDCCNTISDFEDGVDHSLEYLFDKQEANKILGEDLDPLVKMDSQFDVMAMDGVFNDSDLDITITTEKEQSKGKQKSIKRFFGRK